MNIPKAVVFGCKGFVLSSDERRFFADSQPAGFILFRRNIESPGQVQRLVESLKESVGRSDAMIMTDQEGGRVQRFGPPTWMARPAMKSIGDLESSEPDEALDICYVNARLIAAELLGLGINVNCAPVLDVLHPDGHDIIGNRAFSGVPSIVSSLGRAACQGFLDGGVMPVVKHLPGHGRARSDSHVETPRVDAPLEELRQTDFVPFAALGDAPAGMTAHVVYSAVDAELPASVSRHVVVDTIRSEIGFQGLLFSDDVCMSALSGSMPQRVRDVLAAGCDIALHCDGDLDGMVQIAETCPEMRADSLNRLRQARGRLATEPVFLDPTEAQSRVDEFMRRVAQEADN